VLALFKEPILQREENNQCEKNNVHDAKQFEGQITRCERPRCHKEDANPNTAGPDDADVI